MKTPAHNLFVKSLLLGLLTFSAYAEDTKQPTTARAEAVDVEPQEKSLGDYMSVISDSLKQSRSADREEDWQQGAQLARQASEAAFQCIQMIPKVITNIPDQAIQQRAATDYRRLNALAYAYLCQLELAYLAEDAEQVKATKSEIFAIRKEGHDKYES